METVVYSAVEKVVEYFPLNNGVFKEKKLSKKKKKCLRKSGKSQESSISHPSEIQDKNQELFECPNCGKKFERQMSLKGHVLKMHPSEIDKNPEMLQFTKPLSESTKIHECFSCGKMFSLKTNLSSKLNTVVE